MEAVEAVNLTKEYDGTLALAGVTFSVEEGSLALLLGPNGAGKTTLLRCLLGLLRFDGELRVFGLDVRRHGKQVRRLVGYVSQGMNLYRDLTVTQILDFFSDLRSVSVNLEELEPLGLREKADVKVGELSGGMVRKLGLFLALMGEPPLLLMDEPFGDLDAKGRLDLIRTLKALRERGKTILVSTHTVSGVLTLADAVMVLSRGRLLRVLRPHELAASLGLTYRIHFRASKEELVEMPLGAELSPAGWITITSHDLYATLSELAKRGISMSGAIVEEPSVDELLMRLTAGGV